MIEIPKQLQNSSFRFIPVNTKTKLPMGKEWNTINNFSYNDEFITNRLNSDNSYGVLGGWGNDIDGYILPIDSDNAECSEWIEKNFPETFTVQSGSKSPGKYHFYYLTNKPTKKTVLEIVNEDKSISRFGEIQGIGAMVVGAGCNHKSGNTYDIVKNVSLTNLSDELLNKLIKKFSNIEDVDINDEKKFKIRKFDKDNIEEQLNITHIISLTNMKKHGNEYYGNHPVHGSEGGMNFWVNPSKGVWHCFRHPKAGGGVASLIAIMEGLIDCSEAVGKLEPQIYAKVLEIAESKYGYVRGGKIQQQTEDAINNIENEINITEPDTLRRNIIKFLEKIAKIQHNILEKYLISKIAYKIKVSKRELLIEYEKIKLDEGEKNPMEITDLLTKEMKEVEYELEPIIPKGALVLFGGKPGQGKSLIVQAIALSLKNKDKKFLGEFTVKNNPKILYYDLENGEKIWRWRMIYLLKGLKLDESNLKNFHLEQNFSKKNIMKELNFSKNYDLIILDSYRRFLKGAENESEITDLFFNEYLTPLLKLGKTVIIIHHFKKANLEEVDDDELMDIFRGSSDIPAQFDVIYGIKKSTETDTPNGLSYDISFIKVKNRQGLPIKNFTFRVTKNDIEKKTEFTFLGYRKLMSSRERIKDLIREFIEEKELIARKDIVDFINSKTGKDSTGSVDKYLKEMLKENSIEQPDYGYGKYQITKEKDTHQPKKDDEQKTF